MNVFSLSWQYTRSRPVAVALNVWLVGLGVAVLVLMLAMQHRLVDGLTRDVAGVDVVVGARGSPLQLLMAGLYHVDAPPGNVALSDLQPVVNHEAVGEWLPLSLGDSLQGHRIVGTTPAWLAWNAATLAQGRVWAAPMEAVLGHAVAQATGLSVGDRFVGTHGLGGGGHAHADQPYTVVGVLAPTARVADRLVLTATESVWWVHESELALDDADRAALQDAREVTLALIRYRSPLSAVSFPRWVQTHTPLQAAAPALELTRLLSALGVGLGALQALGGVMLSSAGLGVWVVMVQAVRERRADLALLRMLGAPPARLLALLVAEATWLASLGVVAGLLVAHAVWRWLPLGLPQEAGGWLSGWPEPAVWWPVPLAVFALAVLAAAWAARAVYRLDVAGQLQADGP